MKTPERVWVDCDMQPWRVWTIAMTDLPEYRLFTPATAQGVDLASWEAGRDAVVALIIRTAKSYEQVDDNMFGSAMRVLAYHAERLTPPAPEARDED